MANAYFVWRGLARYLSVAPRSPILLAFLAVEATVWLIGVYIAVVAFRYVTGQPPLPFGGVGFVLVLLAVSLLPGFIYLQVRRIERGGD